MSKILLINGSPNEKGCTYTALAEIAATLHEQGVETEMIWLGKKPVQDCIACHSCMKTGRCVFTDIVNETADKLAAADGIHHELPRPPDLQLHKGCQDVRQSVRFHCLLPPWRRDGSL